MSDIDHKVMAKRFHKYLKHIELPGNLKRILEEIVHRLKVDPDFDIWGYFSIRLYEIGKQREKRKSGVAGVAKKRTEAPTQVTKQNDCRTSLEREMEDKLQVQRAILEQWDLLSTAWKVLDRNGDNRITREEFEDGLNRSGLEWIDKAHRDEIWSRADLDHNKSLDFRELKILFNRWILASEQKHQRKKNDKSGELSKARVHEQREKEAEKLKKIRLALDAGLAVQEGHIIESAKSEL
mmetsp:Transcript_14782/g.29963  ORF Transcript_14782/g.29963 Transcript_14782/m.29963 type:complete len:238 (-) Transcript_14782:141-854(-)